MFSHVMCPSSLVPDEVWDDTICFECLAPLPDDDPDPENTGASPWWDGFCSEECRAASQGGA
tara:strand:- start:425 stop:610 length:186 start_codon:yes stop_codon:yes gene_type:complete